jgi:DNA-binding IclR family transcriptional regulator
LKDVSSSLTVKSAQRVLSILEILARNPMGLTFTDLGVKLEIRKTACTSC